MEADFKNRKVDLSTKELKQIKRATKAGHKKIGIKSYLLGDLAFDVLGTPSLYEIKTNNQIGETSMKVRELKKITNYELAEALKKHGSWLDGGDKTLKPVNLSYTDLRGMDLSGADLTGINLSYSDLRGCDFSGSNLMGAIMIGTNFEGVDMSRADVFATNMMYANLRGADLTGATLTYTNFRSAKLEGAKFDRADICQINLAYAKLAGMEFEKARIIETRAQ